MLVNIPRPRGARPKIVIIVLLDLFMKLHMYTKSKALMPNNSRSNIVDTKKDKK